MATCKDCLHLDVCVIVEHSASTDEDYLTEFGCEDFKDRSKWVEQKHGRWISKGYQIECSVCGHKAFLGTTDPVRHGGEKNIRKYCPNCGADMREGGEGE